MSNKPKNVFKVFDNDGATHDRYTVVLDDLERGVRSCLGLSGHPGPGHPLGFSQFSEASEEWVLDNDQEDIGWNGLPEEIQKHAAARLK